MSEEYRSCLDRVQDEWEDRRTDLAAILGIEEDEGRLEDLGLDPEDPFLGEYGLAFDYVPAGTFQDQGEGYFRYQLSWGGPADELRFYADPDLRVYKIEYWFLDWSDGAKVIVTNDPVAQAVADWFEGVDAFRVELEKARAE